MPPQWLESVNECVQCVPKNVPLLIFWINGSKSVDLNNFWCTESWGNLRLVGYKFAHFTWKVSLHYLVKFRTIIILLLPACYRNIIIKCFNEEIKASNKNCKVNESAVCFRYTFSFCVIFIVKVYTVLIKVYTVFFGKKWVALKRADCWVAVKRTGYCYFITNTKSKWENK